MDPAEVGRVPIESVLANAGRHQRSSQTEVEAAMRALMEEGGGDDRATCREFLAMVGSRRSGSNGS